MEVHDHKLIFFFLRSTDKKVCKDCKRKAMKIAMEVLNESKDFGPINKESWWWDQNDQDKTRNEECKIYKITKNRERKTRVLDQVRFIKDEELGVLIRINEVKEILKRMNNGKVVGSYNIFIEENKVLFGSLSYLMIFRDKKKCYIGGEIKSTLGSYI
ncbi:hypothetical protein CR513_01743, partial [Mucuna pruriens]